MTTFTRTWNSAYEASPPDSQNASQGATRIRETKIDVRERLAVDHSMAGDANDGAHNKVTLIEQSADPTAAANTGFLYTRDDGNGNTELFYRDNSGNISQLTDKGGLGYVGEVRSFAFTSVPTGWLECDGSTISRTTYADLFAVIGETFGAGDGSTTFQIPDLRGEFIRGYDNGRDVDTGRTFGSAQADAFEQHTHTNSVSTDGSHVHSVPLADSGGNPSSNYLSGADLNVTSGSLNTGYGGSHTHTVTIDDAGTEAETRPRNIALMFCIKY